MSQVLCFAFKKMHIPLKPASPNCKFLNYSTVLQMWGCFIKLIGHTGVRGFKRSVNDSSSWNANRAWKASTFSWGIFFLFRNFQILSCSSIICFPFIVHINFFCQFVDDQLHCFHFYIKIILLEKQNEKKLSALLSEYLVLHLPDNALFPFVASFISC